MNETQDTPKGRTSGNAGHRTLLPTWLDSRTVAIIATMLTVAAALGTMVQTAHSGLRDDIDQLRNVFRSDMIGLRSELRTGIKALDTRLRNVEVDVAAIRERLSVVETEVSAIRIAMTGFDVRLKAVEAHTHDQDRES